MCSVANCAESPFRACGDKYLRIFCVTTTTTILRVNTTTTILRVTITNILRVTSITILHVCHHHHHPMISVKMLLPTLLVVVAAGAALGSPQQATYVTYRREGKEEPASSYASHQPTYGSPAPAQPSHGSQPTSYGAPSTNYGPPTQSYKAQPAVMYALMPSEMPKKEEEKKEEDDKKKKPQTKEEKKCAIKKVLPPLILITIFIGMILLQLWAPRLVASLVNPIVNPIADGIDAIAASIAAGRQSSWNQRAATDDVNIEPALNAIDSFLQVGADAYALNEKEDYPHQQNENSG
ncbi:hypothetical protein HAZT_HAZT008697 [Hyalella azteca]|uniref:Uncharacterized protein n=1 Tax=Hyalella azteca TaxID=294128 RepID=A0A6A0H0H4_HYAAZ|nr:hypothetical protein HAZT_HAZT008697 [Hyalella azteca]